MSDTSRATLGRTGRSVHPLGVASSFGIGGRDLEAAVEEHGVDYLYFGSLRKRSYAQAIRALCARGQRDRLYVVVQSYSRVATLVRPSLTWALRQLGIEKADMLLLGMWNGDVWKRITEAALRCRERGLVDHLGVSTHERTQVPTFSAAGSPFDVVHFRYNAAHRGAETEVFPLVPERSASAGLVNFTATRWGQLLKRPRGLPSDVPVPTAGDCYRFVLSQSRVDVCMSGPKDGAQLQAALQTVSRGPMSEDELAWMRRFGDAVYADSSVATRVVDRV